MATLKSTLTLYDNMSRQLDKIANSLQKTTNMMGGLDSAMGKIKSPDIDTTKTTSKLDSLQSKVSSTKLEPKISADSAVSAGSKINSLNKSLDSTKISMNGVQPAAASASSSISRVGNEAEKTGGIFKTVMGASVVATGISKGMSLISNSVGSAVERFDTLNSYPKVMKQMGFSTKDATKSVEIMKSGVDGLPTSLQELTKSAQSFAILQKNATGGAKTATALNDAFLASGASGADASRGVQQYSQMLASGKVDLQSWRTLQETMPYALTKVANSFGLTGKSAERDLYSKLENGQITMEQLNDRFVELDGGATGFAKTARVASQGIGTSMTNLKNSITKGLADSITALDKGIRTAGKGGIAQILDNSKVAIGNFFKTFNGFIEKAIPKIISFLKAIKPILTFLGNLVVAALPVGGVFIAASGGVLAFNKAMSGMTSLFNVAKAHPYLAIIFALGTAFMWLYQNVKPFRKFVNGTLKDMEKSLKSLSHMDWGDWAKLGSLIIPLAGASVKLLLLAKRAKKAAKATEDVAKGTKKAANGVTSLKAGLNNLMKLAGLSLVIASLSLLATAMVPLAKTGKQGAIAMGAFAISVSTMAVALGLMGKKLDASKGGLIAFGAAVGIMALAMTPMANTGTQGAIAMLAFAGAVSIMAVALGLMGSQLQQNMAGILVFSVAVGIMALAMAPLATTGMQGAIAMGAFAVSVSVMAVALGLMGPMLQTSMAGIIVFAAAVSVMALAMAPLAATGTQGAIAMAAFGIVVAGLAIVFAIFGPALTAASVGMLVFGVMAMMVGAAVMMVGTGIMIAMVGVSMLGAVLPVIAANGMQAAIALLAFSGSLILFSAGALLGGVAAIVLSAGLLLLSAGLFAVGAGALVAGAGFVVLGAGLVVVGAGLMAVSAGIMALYTTIVTIFSNIVGAISGAMSNALSAVSNGISNMVSAVQNVGGSLVDAGKNFVMGFVNGIKNAIGSAVDAAANMAKSAVGAAKKFLNIHSPSRVMRDQVGRFFAEGMAVGIDNNASGVSNASANMASSAVDAASGMAFPDISAPNIGIATNPGNLLADGFNNALYSLQSLLGLMGKTDGTNIGVTNNGGQSGSGFNTAGLMVSGGTQSTTNSDHSQTVNVESGAIQIVTNGSDVDGETIARKLEEFLKHRADANLNHA